jgi:hypothetical protein
MQLVPYETKTGGWFFPELDTFLIMVFFIFVDSFMAVSGAGLYSIEW